MGPATRRLGAAHSCGCYDLGRRVRRGRRTLHRCRGSGARRFIGIGDWVPARSHQILQRTTRRPCAEDGPT